LHAHIPRRQEKDHIRQQRWQQQVQLFEMVKGLHGQGLRASDIVRQTGISRGRVDKWLRLEQCPPRSRKMPRQGLQLAALGEASESRRHHAHQPFNAAIEERLEGG
jgi:hypothetical protein